MNVFKGVQASGWKRSFAKFAGAAILATTAAGCGLMASKDLAEGLESKSNFGQENEVFDEIPTGATVGTVVVPNFQSALRQEIELMGLAANQRANLNAISASVPGMLPEIGTASAVVPSTVFGFTRLFVASCTDKCNADRANANQADRLCTFNLAQGLTAGTNAAAWDKSIRDMGALFWGRPELTDSEMATLRKLRDDVGGVSLSNAPGNTTNAHLAAFTAVCLTMKLAPDGLVQ